MLYHAQSADMDREAQTASRKYMFTINYSIRNLDAGNNL